MAESETKLTKLEKKEKLRQWRWWKSHPQKLTKLEQAFAIGCTDKEACGYAEITERQLYYYEKLNPEFVSRKDVLKDTVILKAKQTIANKIGDNYHNAMDFLKRKRKDEYGDNIDMTSLGKSIQTNVITFNNFDDSDSK